MEGERWRMSSPSGAGPVDADLELSYRQREEEKTVSRATVCPINDRSADL